MNPQQRNTTHSCPEGSSMDCPPYEGPIRVENPNPARGQHLAVDSLSEYRSSNRELGSTIGRRSDSFYSADSILKFAKDRFGSLKGFIGMGKKSTPKNPQPNFEDMETIDISTEKIDVLPAITGTVTLELLPPSKEQIFSSPDKIIEDTELLKKYGHFDGEFYFFRGKAITNDIPDSDKIKLYRLYLRPGFEKFKVDNGKPESLVLYLYQTSEECKNNQTLRSLLFSKDGYYNDLLHKEIKSFLGIKGNIMLFSQTQTIRVQHCQKLCNDSSSLDLIAKLEERYDKKSLEIKDSRYEMIGERFVFGILNVQFTQDQGRVKGNGLSNLISTNIPNTNSLNNNSPNTAANTNSNPSDDNFRAESNLVQPLNKGQPVPLPSTNVGEAHSAHLFVLLEPPKDDWNSKDSGLMYLEEIPDSNFNMINLEKTHYFPHEVSSGKSEDLLVLQYEHKLVFYQFLMDKQRKVIHINHCPVEKRDEKKADSFYSLKPGEKITIKDVTHIGGLKDNDFKVVTTHEGLEIIVKRPIGAKTSNGPESIETLFSTQSR